MHTSPRIPHLTLPLRMTGSGLAWAEQDTLDEIASSVEAILRYQPGDLDHEPALGMPDQAFRQGGADADEILAVVERWDERAEVVVTEDPSRLDELIDTVRVDVSAVSEGE
jgi:hypothetical protein